MNPVRIIKSLIIAIMILYFIGSFNLAIAEDRVVTGEINGSKSIESDEGIIFENLLLGSNAKVTTQSNFELHLKPGTRIAAGAKLTVNIRDNDGLSNRCELYYFNHLNYGPDDDPDIDILTNMQECTLGTDPTYTDKDNDDDGMEDWWELKYFEINDLAQLKENGRDDDSDGDHISNWIEYRLGLDPSHGDNKHPGLHYDYDDLGRIIRIERIPFR